MLVADKDLPEPGSRVEGCKEPEGSHFNIPNLAPSARLHGLKMEGAIC